MKLLGILILSATLLGCTTPNVTQEISGATELIGEIKPVLTKTLAKQAADDLRRAENDLIVNGDIVLDLTGCDPIDDADTYDLLPNCRLVNNADPNASRLNAYSVLAFMNLVDGYYAALSALASSQNADAIGAQTNALFVALEKAGAERNGALGILGTAASKNKDLGTRAAGFFANQYRIVSLRRVVRQADPLISEGAKLAAAYFDTENSAMRRNQRLMLEASLAADSAAEAGNFAAQREALDQFKSAYSAFSEAERTSPATAFRLLARQHNLLLQQLDGTASAEQVFQTLTTIDEILIAYRKRG